MFWSTFHYAGSCICLFVMSKYIANFFFMGNLAAVKLLLLFSPQKHSGSLSHSSLTSQKKKKHCTNIIWQQDQKPSRKVKLLTYLMDSVQSIGMKKQLFKMHYSDYFQKELLRTFFFAFRSSVSKDQCSQKMIVISIQAVQIWRYESLLRPVWVSTCTWKPEALRAAAQPLRTEHSVITEMTLIEYNIAWKE